MLPDFPPPSDANSDDDSADAALDTLLRQLRAQPAPEPRPFFYTRLRARLDTETDRRLTPAAAPWWLRHPAYATALAALVLALNIGTAVRYGQPAPPPALPPPPTDPAYAAFVTEYQLDPFTLPASDE